MARYLFVVSRDHPGLYEYLLERFRDDPRVTVIVDRRVGAAADTHAGGERRTSIADDLTVRSHQIVTLQD